MDEKEARSRVRETGNEDDRRQREIERCTSFDSLDVTNCLLPHARLSHRTEWGWLADADLRT